MARILYISYDGLMEPLGQSQVLQYLKKLSVAHSITLVTYEKREDWRNVTRRKALIAEVRGAAIRWVPLRYHRRPSLAATAYDIAVGLVVCTWLVLRHRIQIVHARSYVGSLIPFFLKQLFRTQFVFDMRGFWIDERAEGGSWTKESLMYKVGKAFERNLLIRADVVVSLTRTAVGTMRRLPFMRGREQRFVVVPTCTNLELFRPVERRPANMPRQFVMGYVGAVGPRFWFDHVLTVFRVLRSRNTDAKLLIINRHQHSYISERISAHSIDPSHVEVKEVQHCEVPREIARMDIGVFFYVPTFSRLATAPTRLGEFLGCGVPCLTNGGVGDVDQIVQEERVGILVSEFSPAAIAQGVDDLLRLLDEPGLRDRCVTAARKHFSLADGVAAYSRIYYSLARGGAGNTN